MTLPNSPAELLVLADAWTEHGDPRGELIVISHALSAMPLDDVKRSALVKRESALGPAARRAWGKELGVVPTNIALEGGVPCSVSVTLGDDGPKAVPDSDWVRELHVGLGSGKSFNALLEHPGFARCRKLVVGPRVVFTGKAFRAFCASEHVRHLEALDIEVNAKTADAFAFLLHSRSFERLQELDLGYVMRQPDVSSIEQADGLPALERLRIGRDGLAAPLVRSPLALRLHELNPGSDALADIAGVRLPRLRRLVICGPVEAGAIEALAKAESLPGLEAIEFADAIVPDKAMGLLAQRSAFPSLRRLDVTRTKLGAATRDALRARFGESLVVA
jgi:hypothetical protein